MVACDPHHVVEVVVGYGNSRKDSGISMLTIPALPALSPLGGALCVRFIWPLGDCVSRARVMSPDIVRVGLLGGLLEDLPEDTMAPKISRSRRDCC
jgi:hypothetical protein